MGELRYRIWLGKSVAGAANSSYLKVEGGDGSRPTVGVVKAEVADALLVDQRVFAGRSFIPLLASEVSKLRLDGTGGKRQLARSGHRWRFDGMMGDRLVDDEAIDPLLYQFPRIRAESFLDEADAKEALVGERVRISIHEQGAKAPWIVEVGGSCPGKSGMIVAVRERPQPLAGCVTDRVLAGLTLTAESLLDRTAFGFAQDAVESLSLTRGDDALSLKRKEDGFELVSPEKAEVSLEQGNRRILEIVSTGAEVLDAPNLSALGLDPPRGRAVLRGLPKTGTSAV
jgi:hypothetical protein